MDIRCDAEQYCIRCLLQYCELVKIAMLQSLVWPSRILLRNTTKKPDQK